MKIDTNKAEKRILRLRGYSHGNNDTDCQLVTEALRTHPDVSGILLAAFVFYQSLKKAMPEYQLWSLLTIIVIAAVGCWFVRKSVKELEAVQDLFLASASNNIEDVLRKYRERNEAL